MREDGPEFPYEFKDLHGKRVCGICIDGIVPRPYRVISDRSTGGNRVYRFAERPSLECMVAFDAYLEKPGCTAARHDWWEEAEVSYAWEHFRRAFDSLAEILKRKAGWSCTYERPT